MNKQSVVRFDIDNSYRGKKSKDRETIIGVVSGLIAIMIAIVRAIAGQLELNSAASVIYNILAIIIIFDALYIVGITLYRKFRELTAVEGIRFYRNKKNKLVCAFEKKKGTPKVVNVLGIYYNVSMVEDDKRRTFETITQHDKINDNSIGILSNNSKFYMLNIKDEFELIKSSAMFDITKCVVSSIDYYTSLDVVSAKETGVINIGEYAETSNNN